MVQPLPVLALAGASFLAACASSPAAWRFVAAPGSPMTVGSAPNSIETADLDGDRRLDLVVTDGRQRAVMIFLGDGRGGFTPAPRLEVPTPPHLSAAGDLDGDGRPDLVVTGHDSYDVFAWLGAGGGRFAAAPGSPFPALAGGKPHNHGLALGDVDGDGDLDVLTTDDTAHAVAVRLNDGRGGLRPAPRSSFAVGREPYPLALGDLNGDRHLDVVTPNVGSGSISVLLGDGRGGFQGAPRGPVAVTARPYFVALGDVDGNGVLDAVVTHDDVSVVTTLLGDGDGAFRLPRGSPFNVGRRAWKAVLHDLDRDGRLDLALAAGGKVVVRRGDGRGGFPPPGAVLDTGPGSWSLALGDFDGDGKADIATTNVEAGAVTILLQR